MISIETMKHRTEQMVGEEFPLVFWRGKGRIVGADEGGLSLLVRGMRADYTWDRLTVTWQRLLANHTLTVDELGGGHDAVGIVSIFAAAAGRRPRRARRRRAPGAQGAPRHPGASVRRHEPAHVVGPVAAQDPRRLTPALAHAAAPRRDLRFAGPARLQPLGRGRSRGPYARRRQPSGSRPPTASPTRSALPAKPPDAVDWERINPATGPVFVRGRRSPATCSSVLVERIEVAHRRRDGGEPRVRRPARAHSRDGPSRSCRSRASSARAPRRARACPCGP